MSFFKFSELYLTVTECSGVKTEKKYKCDFIKMQMEKLLLSKSKANIYIYICVCIYIHFLEA